MKNMVYCAALQDQQYLSFVKAGAQVVSDNFEDELFITIGNGVGASAGRMLQSYLQLLQALSLRRKLR